MKTLREPFLFKMIRAERSDLVVEGLCTDESRHTITIDGRLLIKRCYSFEVDRTRFEGALIDRTPADRITI